MTDSRAPEAGTTTPSAPSWAEQVWRGGWAACASVLTLAAAPVALVAAAGDEHGRQRLAERLGAAPRRDAPAPWLHAASVGEVRVAATLLREIATRHAERDARPSLSTMTRTGLREATTLETLLGAAPFHVPLDAPFAVRRAVSRLRPTCLVLVETEIWPNLLHECARAGVPAVLVNGRFSARAAARARRARALFEPALRSLATLCMRSEEDAQRAIELGAPAARVRVTGDVKLDGAAATAASPALAWTTAAGLDEGDWIVFGATVPGEERLVLDVFEALVRERPALRAVLAPRRPERFEEAWAEVQARRVPAVRRSAIGAGGGTVPAGGLLFLDTLGELARVYGHARAAFVGGSLVPHGGHNLMEPAASGVPVAFGEHVENFRDVEAELLREGGGVRVTGPDELVEVLGRWLDDAGERDARGAAARASVERGRGAARRTIDAVAPWLDGRPESAA